MLRSVDGSVCPPSLLPSTVAKHHATPHSFQGGHESSRLSQGMLRRPEANEGQSPFVHNLPAADCSKGGFASVGHGGTNARRVGEVDEIHAATRVFGSRSFFLLRFEESSHFRFWKLLLEVVTDRIEDRVPLIVRTEFRL